MQTILQNNRALHMHYCHHLKALINELDGLEILERIISHKEHDTTFYISPSNGKSSKIDLPLWIENISLFFENTKSTITKYGYLI